jgi:hypothetical protein
MSQLFGFSIKGKGEDKKPKGQSPVPPNLEDSVTTIAGGYFGSYVDIDGVARNEFDLIKRYRDMSMHPEVDSAIDEIVNEAINSSLDDSPVEIELSNLKVSENIKTKIREEFEYIKHLLCFDTRAHEIFRTWYIDGRLFYHKVIDLANPRAGILELRYIDPLRIKKVRVQNKDPKMDQILAGVQGSAYQYDFGDFVEYYMYNAKGFISSTFDVNNATSGVRISNDSVAYITSGIQDLNKKMVLSYLHKSIKSLNQLRMIEDALVIYRISRAPERRIFYIDVGNLPKVKAEQHLRDAMARYRNKLVYDANTGEIRDDKKHMSMLEDFWLPRREGGRSTEITTLPGGQNLGELTDVEYFKKKLYSSLNLPPSRLDTGSQGFNLGRSTEILRDELKFSKWVARLRKKFSSLFHDILKTQLILKGIIVPEDWENMKEHIQYDYHFDNHFEELKEAELLTNRLNVANLIEPYLGKYYSVEYVRRQVLEQADNEYNEISRQIKAEIASGLIPDPKQTNKMNVAALQNSAIPSESESTSSASKPPASKPPASKPSDTKPPNTKTPAANPKPNSTNKPPAKPKSDKSLEQ